MGCRSKDWPSAFDSHTRILRKETGIEPAFRRLYGHRLQHSGPGRTARGHGRRQPRATWGLPWFKDWRGWPGFLPGQRCQHRPPPSRRAAP